MNKERRPSKQGQIVKLVNPVGVENPRETYLILHDLDNCSDNDIIYVVSITELQRNINNPTAALHKAVTKAELAVVAESLQSYVESWNKL